MRLFRIQMAYLIFLLSMICVNGFAAGHQKHTIVLVSNQNLDVGELAPIEVRKLFLGVPVVVNGQQLNPLRNSTDPLLTEIFLQKVDFMSERSYERTLLSRIYRLGGTRPEIFIDKSKLVKQLNSSPGSLTYMWAEDAVGLKSLGVIWSSSTN